MNTTPKSKQEQVKLWMEMFGQECPPTPKVPGIEVRALRNELIREEALELREALFKQSLPDVADALADILYVVYGTAVACGISSGAMDEIFAEVHRANLAKFWTADEVYNHPQAAKLLVSEVPLKQLEFPGLPTRNLLVKNKEGKVVKPPSFVGPEARIKEILEVHSPRSAAPLPTSSCSPAPESDTSPKPC